jgi:hypothetical protein
VKLTRAQKVSVVRTLRAEGLTHDQIARRLGVSRRTVGSLLADPDGSKQRARRDCYRRPCPECGRPMDGSGGYASSPSLCAACTRARQHESRYWTRERVVDAIRRFAARHGRPPTTTEWRRTNPAEGYPAFSSIYGAPSANGYRAPFATWNDAIRAAGFEPNRTGRRPDDWSRERIVVAIECWADEYGEPPSRRDWRRARDGYPSADSVKRHFGSWRAAMAAAGFAAQ